MAISFVASPRKPKRSRQLPVDIHVASGCCHEAISSCNAAHQLPSEVHSEPLTLLTPKAAARISAYHPFHYLLCRSSSGFLYVTVLCRNIQLAKCCFSPKSRVGPLLHCLRGSTKLVCCTSSSLPGPGITGLMCWWALSMSSGCMSFHLDRGVRLASVQSNTCNAVAILNPVSSLLVELRPCGRSRMR